MAIDIDSGQLCSSKYSNDCCDKSRATNFAWCCTLTLLVQLQLPTQFLESCTLIVHKQSRNVPYMDPDYQICSTIFLYHVHAPQPY